MKQMLNEGNQIHNFISSSGSGTVINYGSGSDFLISYAVPVSGSGSTSQKVKVPTFSVPVPQRCLQVTTQKNLKTFSKVKPTNLYFPYTVWDHHVKFLAS
jgi:hypothetical protein